MCENRCNTATELRSHKFTQFVSTPTQTGMSDAAQWGRPLILTKCDMLQYPIKSTLAVVRPTDDDGSKKTMRQAVSVLRFFSSDGKKQQPHYVTKERFSAYKIEKNDSQDCNAHT